MRGYSSTHVFSIGDCSLLRRAAAYVARVSDRELGGSTAIRCHELARAVRLALAIDDGLRAPGVIDGHYNRVEHSWLVTPWNKILDVYSVGRLPMVQLVDDVWPGTRAALYVPGASRLDIDVDAYLKLAQVMEPRLGKMEPFTAPPTGGH